MILTQRNRSPFWRPLLVLGALLFVVAALVLFAANTAHAVPGHPGPTKTVYTYNPGGHATDPPRDPAPGSSRWYIRGFNIVREVTLLTPLPNGCTRYTVITTRFNVFGGFQPGDVQITERCP